MDSKGWDGPGSSARASSRTLGFSTKHTFHITPTPSSPPLKPLHWQKTQEGKHILAYQYMWPLYKLLISKPVCQSNNALPRKAFRTQCHAWPTVRMKGLLYRLARVSAARTPPSSSSWKPALCCSPSSLLGKTTLPPGSIHSVKQDYSAI